MNSFFYKEYEKIQQSQKIVPQFLVCTFQGGFEKHK